MKTSSQKHNPNIQQKICFSKQIALTMKWITKEENWISLEAYWRLKHTPSKNKKRQLSIVFNR